MDEELETQGVVEAQSAGIRENAETAEAASLTGAEDRKTERKKQFQEDIVWFAKVLLAASLLSLCVRFLTPIIFVDGESMNPTLYDKELCVGCTFLEPKQGDIVIFKNNQTLGKVYIKRVIGEPGDHVQIMDHVVYINGEELEEAYAYFNPEKSGGGYYDIDMVLQADEYFVCGDNRYESRDSRLIGPVQKEDIQAKVILKLDLRWFTNLLK